MITALARGENNKKVLILGITRENVERLMDDQPIHVSSTTHRGFPVDVNIIIYFKETEDELVDAIKLLITPLTKFTGTT